MNDNESLKQHACEFAEWLWKNIDEYEMSRLTYESMYEMFINAKESI